MLAIVFLLAQYHTSLWCVVLLGTSWINSWNKAEYRCEGYQQNIYPMVIWEPRLLQGMNVYFRNTKYLRFNFFQCKLRLKAHELWSHQVVLFRKLPHNDITIGSLLSAFHKCMQEQFVPEWIRSVSACTENHNHLELWIRTIKW